MSDWIDEPKTYDSTPITPEEFKEVQMNLYEEDIDGGLQNIEVPEKELTKMQLKEMYAKSFIDIKDVDGSPCYRTDQVHLKLTGEQLVVLKDALEAVSCNIDHMDYLYDQLEMGNLYEQQSYIRMLRDIVDSTINEYVRYRPYSPFLPTWTKKIGKDDVRKDQDL